MNQFFDHQHHSIGTSKFSTILLIWILVISSMTPLQANDLTEQEVQIASQFNDVFRRAIERVRPAVVYLEVFGSTNVPGNNRGVGMGSGCVIDPKGYIVTNHHVVEGADKIEVILADGRKFVAQEVNTDPDTDLAIVKIDPKDEALPYAAFGDSDKANVGDFVMAMGSPFGFEQTVTMGIISFKGRQMDILDRTWGYENFIQTDADINRGNSGGPLVNLLGEIIGVNANIYSPVGISTGYGFSIPSNQAKYVCQQLITDKQVKRGYLGIFMVNMKKVREVWDLFQETKVYNFTLLPKEQAEKLVNEIPSDTQGVVVSNVIEGAAASQAGFLLGDLIIGMNDKPLVESTDLRNYVGTLRPGEQVQCRLLRDGKEMEITVTLGDRDVAKQRDEQLRKEFIARRQSSVTPLPPNHPPIPNQAPDLQEKSKPKLGAVLQDIRSSGVLILKVLAGSVAANSGLKSGDIVISVDGRAVNSIQDLKEAISDIDFDFQGVAMEIMNRSGKRSVLVGKDTD